MQPFYEAYILFVQNLHLQLYKAQSNVQVLSNEASRSIICITKYIQVLSEVTCRSIMQVITKYDQVLSKEASRSIM